MQKEAHDIFQEYLKSEKHRITPERFEVLDFALAHKSHFGADELYIEMKSNNSNISRATVYNTLELIANCNLIIKRNFGDGKSTYESSFNKINHDHLICTNCGDIIEFSDPEVQSIVNKVSKELGFEPTGYSFNIFGKCKNEKQCSSNKAEADN